MMEEIEQDYNNIVETLTNTFGNVLSRDVFMAIIENCEGDVEQSANAVMNIVMEGNGISPGPETTDDSNQNQQIFDLNNSTEQCIQSAVNDSTAQDNVPTNSIVRSYALASQTSKPRTNLIPKPTMPSTDISEKWTTQLRQIMVYHEKGARILIIMRGAPGSGKSYLAKQLLNAMLNSILEENYYIHILSTDDYFMRNGVYFYEAYRILEAHEWNQKRATQAMRQGISPVIIDNTNIEYFEMERYVREGVNNGYIIEVVEPNTSWAKKPSLLVQKNSHNVPMNKIRMMLEKYKNGITGTLLMKKFNCYYMPQMQPPVLRNMPPIPQKHQVSSSLENGKQDAMEIKMSPSTSLMDDNIIAEISPTSNIQAIELKSQESNSLCDEKVYSNLETVNKNDKVIGCLEEMEKVEIEWENGESWDDDRNNINEKIDGKILPEFESNSKPQRRNKSPRSLATEKLMPFVNDCQDWTKVSELPSLDEKKLVPLVEKTAPILENKSLGTSVERGESSTLNLNNSNINKSYVALKTNKMSEKLLIDKSASTSNDEILTENHRCPHEKLHFKVFRNFFQNIPRYILKDIFDKCLGDVNWAVEIVLEGTKNSQFCLIENKDSSDEEETQILEMCQCLSYYSSQLHNNVQSTSAIGSQKTSDVSLPSYQLKKVKKETRISEASKELKRKIEENFVIPSSHSRNGLKIRNFHRGDEEISPKNVEHLPVVYEPPSTSQTNCNMPSTSYSDNNEISDDDTYVGLNDTESTVNVVLGAEFIAQLDQLFGRTMEYPKNVNLKINMPMSLLNEINALWVESLMHQLEQEDKQSEMMIQQDEQIAREIAVKEAELSQAGKEPAVPDLKEIMDMDFALSLYHKDVAETLNNKPLDMAEKLSREKLYNLFPDIQPVVLSELLAAHEENFQTTVEVLLMSTGKVDLIDEENGINKFVMDRELQRHHEKLVEAEKQTLSEVKWPILPKWEKVDMSVVEKYRQEADMHLQKRNTYLQKAQEFTRRGMTQIAMHCSNVAAYHTKTYEYTSSLAAASLIQVHASNNNDNATIDFHYLRVPEARESLDLFLDTHIQKLREVQDKNLVKHHTLYFITGRGLHSNGGPRIKPAIKKRLMERGLAYTERNPGLLTAKVTANDKMSYQLS